MTPTTVRHHHLRVARTRLSEAGVPPQLLSARDLLAYDVDQWATLIALARRTHLARLAEVAADPVRRFREAYRRSGVGRELLL